MRKADIFVTAIAYNNHIFWRMLALGVQDRGTPSISQLCVSMGLTGHSDAGEEAEVRGIVGLKLLPVDSHGNWKRIAVRIARALRCDPDDLWPGTLRTELPEHTSKSFSVHIGDEVKWRVM